jgi:hypothetical protein
VGSRGDLFQALGGAIGDIGGTVMRRQASTQLSHAQIEVTTAYRDFFRDLDMNSDPSTYQTQFDDFTEKLRDTQEAAVTIPMAQREFDVFFDSYSKGQATDKLYAITDRNSKTFGYQNLVTDLTKAISGAPAPLTTPKEFVDGQIQNIRVYVAEALQGGVINADQAAEIERAYVEKFQYGYARDMAYEVMNTLMSEGETMADTLDLLEQATRLEGEAYDELIKGTVRTDIRLANLAEGYKSIALTPDAEERLVGELRREASTISNRIKSRREEEAAINDSELAILWATGDRNEMIADNYKMLFDMYPEDPGARNKWIIDLGKWKGQEAEKAQAREKTIILDKKLQGFTDRTENVRVSLDVGAIDALRGDIADADIPNEKRRALLSTLGTIRNTAIKEEDPDTLKYDTLLAGFDTQIDVLGDAVREGNGSISEIKALRRDISRHPDLIQEEQDRTERTGDLTALLDKMVEQPDKNAAKVRAESSLGDMFSNRLISPEQLRDAIRTHELSGALPGDDANAWFGRIKDREDRYLGHTHATEAYNAINRAFDSLILRADPEETARLASEQTTAFNMYDALLEKESYRGMSQAQQKEEMDALLKTVLEPSVSRGVLGWLGIGSDTSLKDLDTYVDLPELQRQAVRGEVSLEGAKDFEAEFSGHWLAEDMKSNTAFGSKEQIIDDTPQIVYRHNATGVLFSKFKKGNRWYWRARFPGDTEWVPADSGRDQRDVEARMDALNAR